MSENSLLPPVCPLCHHHSWLPRHWRGREGASWHWPVKWLLKGHSILCLWLLCQASFFFHKILLPAGEIRSRGPLMATPSFLICLRKSPSWPLLRAKVRQLNWCKGPGLAPMALPWAVWHSCISAPLWAWVHSPNILSSRGLHCIRRDLDPSQTLSSQKVKITSFSLLYPHWLAGGLIHSRNLNMYSMMPAQSPWGTAQGEPIQKSPRLLHLPAVWLILGNPVNCPTFIR